MAILPQIIGSLSAALARAALAQDCLLCALPSGNSPLCTACAADLPRLPGACCPRCALPTPAGTLCGRCLAHPPHYDRAIAAYRYDFPLDKLIHAFKYGHRLAIAPFFGQSLAALASDLTADVIVPLPLHPLRLKERGFNQALELARPVSRALRVPLRPGLCVRLTNTPPQAALPLPERTRNLRGAFHCPADLSGQRVLLVDDVMTTGASLAECARTLKLHGAVDVTLLVLARALPASP